MGSFFDALYDPITDTYHMHLASIRSQKSVRSIDEQSEEDVSNVLKLNDYRKDMAKLMTWLLWQEINGMKNIVTKSVSLEHSLKEDDIEGEPDAKSGSGLIFRI